MLNDRGPIERYHSAVSPFVNEYKYLKLMVVYLFMTLDVPNYSLADHLMLTNMITKKQQKTTVVGILAIP